MAVYVDDMKAKFGRLVMCHMLADTEHELEWMAKMIGVNLKWWQDKGTYRSHFDICMTKRAMAVARGAKEITWRDAGMLIRQKRTGQQPADAGEL